MENLKNEKSRREYDTDEIIQEVTNCKIAWTNKKGHGRVMQYSTFVNRTWLKKN